MKHKKQVTPRSFLTILCVVLIMVFGTRIFAQAGIDTGSVTGTVKDPSGALVQKAQCTLTNQDTGVSQTTVTTSAGAYVFALLEAGTYTLKVTASGFKEYELGGLVVHIGDTVTEDLTLQVGAENVTVSVTSAAPLLQAQDASLGMTVDTTMAQGLPIFGGTNGRSFMQLINVAPGVQWASNNSLLNTGTFLVNGVQSSQVDVRLNGADDNVEVFGGITIPPIIDAIQEFKIEDGSNSVDLGEFYGPVVNVVTKAGTNQFRGSVWEYNENDMFNANDYFNKLHELVTNSVHTPNRPGRYKENSFGGVFGGPVTLFGYNGHGRTFFTIDAQRTDYSQVNQWTETVPTGTMQSSDFTNLSDTLTLNYQGSTGNPLSSMKVDALGRYFQEGMMLDPATTRAVACGSPDLITGLTAGCPSGSYVITNPNNVGGTGSTQKYGIVRDPFLSTASGCPSLAGTLYFNSTYNTGNGSLPATSYPANCFNQLPGGRLDPNAIALLQLFPKSNQQNASSLTYANNYYSAPKQPTYTTQYDIRIDHKLNDKDSLLGTYSYYLTTSPGAVPLPGILEGGTGSNGGNQANFAGQTTAYMVVVSETHVFKPNLVNEFRFGNSRQIGYSWDPGNIDSETANGGIPAQYGIEGIPQAGAYGLGNGGLPDFNVNSSIAGFGSRSNITYRDVGTWLYSDNLTKIKGKHELKLGGEWLWTYGNIAQMPTSRGSFSYGGFSNVPNSGDNGPGMADFLLLPADNVASGAYTAAGVNALSTSVNEIGGLSSYSGNDFNLSQYAAPYLAFYGVDNWKTTPNLTINLGIREEWFGPYYSGNGQQSNLWMGGGGNTASGTAFYIAHDGCASTLSTFFVGLLAYDQIPIVCMPHNNANKTPMANWSPRIGFAYRVTPRIVWRAGASIAYGGFGSIGYSGTLGTNYPFRFTVSSTGSSNAYTPNLIGAVNATTGLAQTTATMENTFGVINLDNPSTAYLPLGGISLYGKEYHFHEPHVKTLNTAVQWQFTNHDSVQATYVANIGQNLESADPYNNAPNELLTPSTTTVTIGPQIGSCAPYCATGYVPFPNLNALTGPMENTEQVELYQSGMAEYQHQFAAGFNMDANYTYASCLSDAQGGQQNSGGPANGRAPWVTGYRYDYDRCENVAANVFKLSGEYNLPFGKGSYMASHANALEDAFIGGWIVDPIWIASSGDRANIGCQGANGSTSFGAPSGTFTGPWFQTSHTAFACDAPDIPGVPIYGRGANDLPHTRTTGYWNSSAWSAPGPVTVNGQSDWSPLGVRGDQLYGPGWYDVDFSLHKQFNTGEGTKLEVQMQAINAFNHVQLNLPGTSTYTTPGTESLTGGFGTITNDHLANGEGRILQFVGKFFF
jgi:Carboxypeptidase regulatory-like domain